MAIPLDKTPKKPSENENKSSPSRKMKSSIKKASLSSSQGGEEEDRFRRAEGFEENFLFRI